MGPRDHDRPGCGGRGVAGFPGSRRLHGVPTHKGDGRGYHEGVQSQRLWDGGGE